jgi:chaperonin GroEL (HSP60 family)
MHNCGEDPDSVRNAIFTSDVWSKNGLPNVAFDVGASTHVLVDPFKAGIIEPAKVCRVSIGNALSVASLLITLGGIVVVPRDANMENQLEASKSMFKEMMSGGGVGDA